MAHNSVRGGVRGNMPVSVDFAAKKGGCGEYVQHYGEARNKPVFRSKHNDPPGANPLEVRS